MILSEKIFSDWIKRVLTYSAWDKTVRILMSLQEPIYIMKMKMH